MQLVFLLILSWIISWIISGILILAGGLLFWLSGLVAGALAPIANLLDWLTPHVPGTPAQSALMSTTLLFLFFRLLHLRYWVTRARVNRATGEVRPELVSRSHGGRARGDWCAPMAAGTDPYPTNRAYRRLILLQLLGCVFYFAVLRATEHGMPAWPAARSLCLTKTCANVTEAVILGCMFFGAVAATGCIAVVGLAAAIAAMLSGVLSVAGAFLASGPGAFVRSHRRLGVVIPVFVAEGVLLCILVLATWCFCSNHPFTDYLLGGYALALVLYAPIWSAASTFLDWRNDRWVASVVRQSQSAVDSEVRRDAERKLANLGPWSPK